jgi:hypothetical protein
VGCSDRARLAIAQFLPGDDLTVLVPVLEQFVVSYTLNIHLLEEILLSEECLKILGKCSFFLCGGLQVKMVYGSGRNTPWRFCVQDHCSFKAYLTATKVECLV